MMFPMKAVRIISLSSLLLLETGVSEEVLIIMERDGSETRVPALYERVKVEEKGFKDAFAMEPALLDISVYQERYQYTLNADSYTTVYRLYLMDNEVWLACLNNGSMWSIYKISRFEGAPPDSVTEAEGSGPATLTRIIFSKPRIR